MKGFMVAAPASGSGKTTVTLGLMRVLTRKGMALAPVKAGPDRIDPACHGAASGAECFNLDPWAMRPELISALSARMTEGGRLLVAEGMRGLFDGAPDGRGSSADLARLLGLPVVLVVDCAQQAQSVAALVYGFSQFRRNVLIAGVVLNRVGGAGHEALLREALKPLGIPVLGALPHDAALARTGDRAGGPAGMERFLDHAADRITQCIDLAALERIWSASGQRSAMANVTRLTPLGSRIAVARDEAFSFAYAHLLAGWRRRGAEISFFSPLGDEAPDGNADAVYLPGGQPALHAGRLAAADRFRAGMKAAAARGATVYGECGGYAVLGEGLEDADGAGHAMLGLLPLETGFAGATPQAGYRVLQPLAGSPWQALLKGHEFQHAGTVREGDAPGLFGMRDALGGELGQAGLRVGSVAGSFVHVIDFAGEGM